MTKAQALLPFLAMAALGACNQTQPAPAATAAPPVAEPAQDQCGASRLAEYLNALPTSDIMDRIRAAAGHDRIRVIEPGSAVTMDYRPDRLNLDIGEDGRIKRFHCV